MKKLLYKEFRLSLDPISIMFAFFGPLLMVPSYPDLIPFACIYFSILEMFVVGRDSKDIAYSLSLPIRKIDVVKARFTSTLLLEVISLVFAAPFAIISMLFIAPSTGGNLIFLDSNLTLFGLAMALFGILNISFFPLFYKTGYKLAKPLIISAVSMLSFGAISELLIQLVPAFKLVLDGALSLNNALWQALVFVLDAIVWIFLTYRAYRLSTSYFEKDDILE